MDGIILIRGAYEIFPANYMKERLTLERQCIYTNGLVRAPKSLHSTKLMRYALETKEDSLCVLEMERKLQVEPDFSSIDTTGTINA